MDKLGHAQEACSVTHTMVLYRSSMLSHPRRQRSRLRMRLWVWMIRIHAAKQLQRS